MIGNRARLLSRGQKEAHMPQPMRFTLPALWLSISLSACSGEHDEVDRGAQPIAARDVVGIDAWEADGLDFALVSVDGARRMVATRTLADTPIVVVADEHGAPLAAATGEGDTLQYLDVAALIDDRELILVDAPTEAIDAESAALVELVASGELELSSFRAALVAAPDPAALKISCAIGWVIASIDNAINTPELMMPSLSDWCG
jgi:hypothetical protein